MNRYYVSFVCLDTDYEYGFTVTCENTTEAVSIVRDKLFEMLTIVLPKVTLVLKDFIIC